jgi:peptidoglycan/xylan/chitin deacetylase (PgdA/CDA1 family)
MLKHGTILILFLVLLFVLLYFDQTMGVSTWLYVGLVLAFLAVEFYGAAYMSSNFHLNAICKGEESAKALSLTFDDGPCDGTPKVLAVLKEHNCKASFFVIGKQAEKFPELVKQINAEGHIIGNHSYGHEYWFHMHSGEWLKNEIERTNQVIQKIIGLVPLYFRPPYGVTTPALSKALSNTKHVTVGWSLRTFDTKIADHQKLTERIKKKIHPGAILLFHDRVPGIEIVLNDVIIFAKRQGYVIVPLPTLIAKDGITV